MKPLLATAIAAVFFCSGVYANEDLTCMAVEPNFEFRDPENKRGFELIDMWQREVWATADWSEAEFKDFDLPLSYVFWRKNDPRTPLPNTGEFLRSPGCEVGEYSYLRAFGRTFFQVVNLRTPINFSDKEGKLRGIKLEKYHRITYAAGVPIRLLVSPEEETYIAVAKSAAIADEPAPLPLGWQYQNRILPEDLVVDLFGEITVLRTQSEVSYQGPIEISF